ncbi:SH3 and multiple ankyrin repeat domains protein 2 [Galemys pyrenaicus]|uniref:SH3 and multiple ankyrin repeat domains protein 2 n=1 Tax=Galemys pyrenaicus TaxID=202257 RepID=A0A8J6DUP2_GALPY|nr:SH3 and multiple ankyrin repeat domains protein 2 [Galemys pyrenaicus]
MSLLPCGIPPAAAPRAVGCPAALRARPPRQAAPLPRLPPPAAHWLRPALRSGLPGRGERCVGVAPHVLSWAGSQAPSDFCRRLEEASAPLACGRLGLNCEWRSSLSEDFAPTRENRVRSRLCVSALAEFPLDASPARPSAATGARKAARLGLQDHAEAGGERGSGVLGVVGVLGGRPLRWRLTGGGVRPPRPSGLQCSRLTAEPAAAPACAREGRLASSHRNAVHARACSWPPWAVVCPAQRGHVASASGQEELLAPAPGQGGARQPAGPASSEGPGRPQPRAEQQQETRRTCCEDFAGPKPGSGQRRGQRSGRSLGGDRFQAAVSAAQCCPARLPPPGATDHRDLGSVRDAGLACRTAPEAPAVNNENVVKVGHRQVVHMIRQGGNHLVLKVVTVTRSLDPDDTARKKAPPPPKRAPTTALTLRSKSMTSELEELEKPDELAPITKPPRAAESVTVEPRVATIRQRPTSRCFPPLSDVNSVYERQGIAVTTPTVPGSPKGPLLGLPRGTMRRQKSIGCARTPRPGRLCVSSRAGGGRERARAGRPHGRSARAGKRTNALGAQPRRPHVQTRDARPAACPPHAGLRSLRQAPHPSPGPGTGQPAVRHGRRASPAADPLVTAGFLPPDSRLFLSGQWHRGPSRVTVLASVRCVRATAPGRRQPGPRQWSGTAGAQARPHTLTNTRHGDKRPRLVGHLPECLAARGAPHAPDRSGVLPGLPAAPQPPEVRAHAPHRPAAPAEASGSVWLGPLLPGLGQSSGQAPPLTGTLGPGCPSPRRPLSRGASQPGATARHDAPQRHTPHRQGLARPQHLAAAPRAPDAGGPGTGRAWAGSSRCGLVPQHGPTPGPGGVWATRAASPRPPLLGCGPAPPQPWRGVGLPSPLTGFRLQG